MKCTSIVQESKADCSADDKVGSRCEYVTKIFVIVHVFSVSALL